MGEESVSARDCHVEMLKTNSCQLIGDNSHFHGGSRGRFVFVAQSDGKNASTGVGVVLDWIFDRTISIIMPIRNVGRTVRLQFLRCAETWDAFGLSARVAPARVARKPFPIIG